MVGWRGDTAAPVQPPTPARRPPGGPGPRGPPRRAARRGPAPPRRSPRRVWRGGRWWGGGFWGRGGGGGGGGGGIGPLQAESPDRLAAHGRAGILARDPREQRQDVADQRSRLAALAEQGVDGDPPHVRDRIPQR